MSTTATTRIVCAEPVDVSKISQALALAFHDDPVLGWVSPHPSRRRAQLPALFAAFAEAYLPHRHTYVTDDGTGAALWAPAGVEAISEAQAEAFGEKLSSIMGDDADRGSELSALLEQHKPTQACFYLQFMGVAPQHQGRGLGSRLLTEGLQRCDAAGVPAYLEATSTGNRRLYERHGFVTTAQVRLPEGPPLWLMWRDPVSGLRARGAPRGAGPMAPRPPLL